MNIRVADRTLGECNIEVKTDIGKSEEYAIKSLCMLQLMCMNKQEHDERFTEFIKVLRDAINKADRIYSPGKEDAAIDPIEQFDG